MRQIVVPDDNSVSEHLRDSKTQFEMMLLQTTVLAGQMASAGSALRQAAKRHKRNAEADEQAALQLIERRTAEDHRLDEIREQSSNYSDVYF